MYNIWVQSGLWLQWWRLGNTCLWLSYWPYLYCINDCKTVINDFSNNVIQQLFDLTEPKQMSIDWNQLLEIFQTFHCQLKSKEWKREIIHTAQFFIGDKRWIQSYTIQVSIVLLNTVYCRVSAFQTTQRISRLDTAYIVWPRRWGVLTGILQLQAKAETVVVLVISP